MIGSEARGGRVAKRWLVVGAAVLLLVETTLAQAWPPSSVEQLGGVATVRDDGANAFGYPAPVLDRKQRRRFLVGNSFFKQNWVESPSSASQRDGLGPLFNARSCSSCHLKDGRSAPPADSDHDRHGLLVRIGVRRADAPDAPHPRYGSQVQDSSVQGVAPEARVDIRYREVHGVYRDGTPYMLLEPTYELRQLRYGALGDDATIGPRVAPQLVGLGLLEAVPLAALARMADPNDIDRDGISGRVHYLDAARTVAGRFGWKATEATVRSQTAAAFVQDLGITSRDQPRESLAGAQGFIVASDECEPEIRAATFDKVVFYAQTLAVPSQRNADDPLVRRGQALFEAFGCAACHRPDLETGDAACLDDYRNQRFHPFTDLLLHDMGPGLADEKRDGDSHPTEWRTPPLWGIGLVPVVNGHTRLLHDGRARNVCEAILWHGGEAAGAREFFRRAPATDRAALTAFVRSL